MDNFITIIKGIEDADGNALVKIFVSSGVIFFAKLIAFFIILYIGKLVARGLNRYIDRIPDAKIETGAKQFTKSFVKLGTYTIFFLLGLLLFGFKEQSIVTMISAIGLGIGIALKEFLSNFAGGVVILFAKPFKVGNFIQMNNVMGEVSEIGVFSTKIETLDSREIIIPNNVVISKNIVNFDAKKFRRIQLIVPIAYGIDPAIAIKELANIAKTFEGIENDKTPFINVNSYGDSSVNIEFLVWATNKGFHEYCNVKGDLMQHILNVFKEKNIEIPYNKLDLYFHSEVK